MAGGQDDAVLSHTHLEAILPFSILLNCVTLLDTQSQPGRNLTYVTQLPCQRINLSNSYLVTKASVIKSSAYKVILPHSHKSFL